MKKKNGVYLVILISGLFLLFQVGICSAVLANAIGKITMLRVHDVGTKYGGGTDEIDVEVVVKLDSKPGKAFGFTLRGGTDANTYTHQAMYDLLREAYKNNWDVEFQYYDDPTKNNFVIFRVILSKS